MYPYCSCGLLQAAVVSSRLLFTARASPEIRNTAKRHQYGNELLTDVNEPRLDCDPSWKEGRGVWVNPSKINPMLLSDSLVFLSFCRPSFIQPAGLTISAVC